MRIEAHRVRFDLSDESCVAVCTCGRRALGLTPERAARLIRPHLDAAGQLADAAKASRRLRLHRPA